MCWTRKHIWRQKKIKWWRSKRKERKTKKLSEKTSEFEDIHKFYFKINFEVEDYKIYRGIFLKEKIDFPEFKETILIFCKISEEKFEDVYDGTQKSLEETVARKIIDLSGKFYNLKNESKEREDEIRNLVNEVWLW